MPVFQGCFSAYSDYFYKDPYHLAEIYSLFYRVIMPTTEHTLCNSIHSLVQDAIHGFVLSNPNIKYLEGFEQVCANFPWLQRLDSCWILPSLLGFKDPPEAHG